MATFKLWGVCPNSENRNWRDWGLEGERRVSELRMQVERGRKFAHNGRPREAMVREITVELPCSADYTPAATTPTPASA